MAFSQSLKRFLVFNLRQIQSQTSQVRNLMNIQIRELATYKIRHSGAASAIKAQHPLVSSPWTSQQNTGPPFPVTSSQAFCPVFTRGPDMMSQMSLCPYVQLPPMAVYPNNHIRLVMVWSRLISLEHE